jgi:hypothetical protein
VSEELNLGWIGNMSYRVSPNDFPGLEKIGADTSGVLFKNSYMNTGAEVTTLTIIADVDGRLSTVFQQEIESGNRSSGPCDRKTGVGCDITTAEYRFVDRGDGRPWDLVIDSYTHDGTSGTVLSSREQQVQMTAQSSLTDPDGADDPPAASRVPTEKVELAARRRG